MSDSGFSDGRLGEARAGGVELRGQILTQPELLNRARINSWHGGIQPAGEAGMDAGGN